MEALSVTAGVTDVDFDSTVTPLARTSRDGARPRDCPACRTVIVRAARTTRSCGWTSPAAAAATSATWSRVTDSIWPAIRGKSRQLAMVAKYPS